MAFDYYTDASHNIGVTLNGVPIGAVWKTFSGAGLTMSNTKIRPAGVELDLPGPGTRDDATVGCYATAASRGALASFERGGRMTVSITPKDSDGNPSGATRTYTGNVKGVTEPDLDTSNSSPESVNYEIAMGCDELVAVS